VNFQTFLCRRFHRGSQTRIYHGMSSSPMIASSSWKGRSYVSVSLLVMRWSPSSFRSSLQVPPSQPSICRTFPRTLLLVSPLCISAMISFYSSTISPSFWRVRSHSRLHISAPLALAHYPLREWFVCWRVPQKAPYTMALDQTP
jgi:hypothetical protein